MLLFKKFNIRRCFGVELEVSSVQESIISASRYSNWIDTKGVMHPKVSREQLRDIIKANSDRPIVVTDWSQTCDNDYWHVKYDSTCGPLGKNKDDGGWEVASYKASGLSDVYHIGLVADALRRAGIEVNQHCGMHIHADASDFRPTQMAILVGRWLKIESWICQMLPPHRRKNKYCKLLKNYHKIPTSYSIGPDDFWALIKPSNLSIHENNQKKVAINIVNYAAALKAETWDSMSASRKTVEFRLPEGTLNGCDITNWIIVYLLFVDMSKRATMPENCKPEKTMDGFLAYFGLESDDALLSYDLFNAKHWLLSRMIELGTPKYVTLAKKKLKMMEIS